VQPISLCIALPCYSGSVPLETMLAFTELIPALLEHGVVVSILTESGNSLPTTARNSLLSQFMETDNDYIFWIDDDIVFTVQDFLQILALTVERKSVAATYPCKSDEPRFIIKPIKDELEFDKDGLILSRGVGMGFSCQHRSAIEHLFSVSEVYQDKGREIREVFKTAIVDGKFQGEDLYFFNELYKNGFITYIHPHIYLKHVGTKYYSHKLTT